MPGLLGGFEPLLPLGGSPEGLSGGVPPGPLEPPCPLPDDVTFTSKLIDGRFPDYEAVIPIGADREVKVDREVMRAALQRAAILSNEKYRGVRVEVTPGQLKISAHNPEQEEAQEEIEADTQVSDLAIGFNVNYLLDALSALRDEHVVVQLRDSNSSALVREAGSAKSRHVVMPLRL